MAKTLRERVAELEAERARIKQMGGPDKVQKQHERGKLTARERLTQFFDGGQYFEIGIHGTQMGQAGASDRPPADAVICGYGPVNGRMVAAGHWKDYAMDMGRDAAVFSAFRRATERPEFRIEKRPALRNRQGQWALIGEQGAVLRRGHELGPVLAPVERRLMKLVAD